MISFRRIVIGRFETLINADVRTVNRACKCNLNVFLICIPVMGKSQTLDKYVNKFIIESEDSSI